MDARGSATGLSRKISIVSVVLIKINGLVCERGERESRMESGTGREASVRSFSDRGLCQRFRLCVGRGSSGE